MIYTGAISPTSISTAFCQLEITFEEGEMLAESMRATFMLTSDTEVYFSNGKSLADGQQLRVPEDKDTVR